MAENLEDELDKLRREFRQELDQLSRQNRELKANNKLMLALAAIVALSILSIKFELTFENGKASGRVSSPDVSAAITKTLELLAAVGVIGASGYALPAAIKSAQLRNSSAPQPGVNMEETQ